MDWKAISLGVTFTPFWWRWGRNQWSSTRYFYVGPFGLAWKF